MGTGSGSGANGEETAGRGSPLPGGGHEPCHPLLSAPPAAAPLPLLGHGQQCRRGDSSPPAAPFCQGRAPSAWLGTSPTLTSGPGAEPRSPARGPRSRGGAGPGVTRWARRQPKGREAEPALTPGSGCRRPGEPRCREGSAPTAPAPRQLGNPPASATGQEEMAVSPHPVSPPGNAVPGLGTVHVYQHLEAHPSPQTAAQQHGARL